MARFLSDPLRFQEWLWRWTTKTTAAETEYGYVYYCKLICIIQFFVTVNKVIFYAWSWIFYWFAIWAILILYLSCNPCPYIKLWYSYACVSIFLYKTKINKKNYWNRNAMFHNWSFDKIWFLLKILFYSYFNILTPIAK